MFKVLTCQKIAVFWFVPTESEELGLDYEARNDTTL
jgi:hypothetical protein